MKVNVSQAWWSTILIRVWEAEVSLSYRELVSTKQTKHSPPPIILGAAGLRLLLVTLGFAESAEH